ncbi:MAG TPA: bifunctional YncE family protein/alkaline phosphatase family protein [Verrucomicrobiae bacterium]|nr:bifunctional YncE family protein/alkaline phosphatase family protein [Verrucomicrobiae bacterium]
MTGRVRKRFLFLAAGLAVVMGFGGAMAQSPANPQSVPNMNQMITPLAPAGARFEPLNPGLADNPAWLAGFAVSTVVSPDRKTLLVLTSGYNRLFNSDVQPSGSPLAPYNLQDSNEYVFIYDISTRDPIQKQVVQIPITYHGIVFDPSGTHFYVSGCTTDNIHTISLNTSGVWAEEQPASPQLALGHSLGIGLNLKPNGATAINSAVGVYPCAAGLAMSRDGQILVAANYYNDSITVFTGGYAKWSRSELDLRPGKSDPAMVGVPGGEYPFWVAVKGSGADATAYVSSVRDREIVVAKLTGPNAAGGPRVVARIPVKGQPNKMTLNAAQSLLYVAEDQTDTVDVIDTSVNTIVETIPVIAPAFGIPASFQTLMTQYTGANTNSVTLSPDEKQLYVTNGNLNSIAVVSLTGMNRGDEVIGLIPTGWYPNSVSFSGDGNTVYVVNGKSPTGPNIGWCYGGYGPVGSKTCGLAQQYNPQLTRAGFQIFPRPEAGQLATLTAQVAANNRFDAVESAADAATMAQVRKVIQHVIFIIKENRTYDQILGDLEIGDGYPYLTEFGQMVTPNQHALASNFVTLDRFLDTAEVSYDGWLWTTSARAPDVIEKEYPVAYGYRGLSLEAEGVNRNVNVSIPYLSGRQAADPFTSSDPDVLPGQTTIGAPDGPDNQVNTGHLWDGALRAGLSVRNYGFFIDTTRYSTNDFVIPVLRDPAATGTVVSYPASAALAPFTDPYFRGFDNNLPDYYRYSEWAREFDSDYTCAGCNPTSTPGLPALSLVRLMHDHTGSFDTAIDGVNTPELMVADNDYAVGLLVEKVAHSKYANNTLIFVVEDDAQDGGDHYDSHRSIAFVAGPYVKQQALVSTQYTTLDFLRTIEEVLGLAPLNLNDALARPMTDLFNTQDLAKQTPTPWSFTALPSPYLYNTQLPLPQPKPARVPKPSHNARYWARATKGMDFEEEDQVDPLDFNHILWKGMMGGQPYPATPTGADMRQDRAALLARYRKSLKKASLQPK